MKKIESKFPGLNVLIVEDNEINQEVSKDILELMSCSVDIAIDGLEAIQMANTKPYQLILMDIQLPHMDGYQATRQIRDQSTHQPIIVALTASALDGDKEKCLSAGMDDYISKPFQASDIEELLKKHFPTFSS